MARDVEGKRVTVVGAARSGIAAAALLADKGARVTLSDVRADVPEVESLHSRDITLELGGHKTETFTAADVDTLTSYAKSNGLAGLHFWSLDRDTPCATTTTYASPTCNSVSGTTALEYTNRFLNDGA